MEENLQAAVVQGRKPLLLRCCIMLKRNYKRIIVIIMALALVIRIGVIAPPVFWVKWYFNANRQSFQNIANLMIHNDYDGEEDLLKDKNLIKSDFIKIRILFCCDYIRGWVHDDSVDFDIANISPQPGEPIAIVYSNKTPRDEQYGDWKAEYEYAYEDLGGNWYLKYRKR